MVTSGKYSVDLTPILEAIHAVILNNDIHKNFGGGAYALNRDAVYKELDARGSSRRNSLSALCSAGILERSGKHFTRTISLSNGRRIRAVFVRLDDKADSATGEQDGTGILN